MLVVEVEGRGPWKGLNLVGASGRDGFERVGGGGVARKGSMEEMV